MVSGRCLPATAAVLSGQHACMGHRVYAESGSDARTRWILGGHPLRAFELSSELPKRNIATEQQVYLWALQR